MNNKITIHYPYFLGVFLRIPVEYDKNSSGRLIGDIINSHNFYNENFTQNELIYLNNLFENLKKNPCAYADKIIPILEEKIIGKNKVKRLDLNLGQIAKFDECVEVRKDEFHILTNFPFGK